MFLPSTPLRMLLSVQIVKPLCRCVENDLRIHVHSLELEHMEAPGPKTAASAEARRLVHLLSVPPFVLLQVHCCCVIVCCYVPAHSHMIVAVLVRLLLIFACTSHHT